jgi:hypothetical protein
MIRDGPLENLSCTEYSSTTKLSLGNSAEMLRISDCPLIQLLAPTHICTAMMTLKE